MGHHHHHPEVTPFDSHCFLKGTKIRTLAGEVAIEQLGPADLIVTQNGLQLPVDILTWSYAKPWQRRVIPIRIAQSAIAPQRPNADLYLSPGHAVMIDGMLVTAESLLNGRSITHADNLEVDELEYFHIRFLGHEVLCAAGLPSESYVETLAEFTQPRLHLTTSCSKVASRVRSAVAPWIDLRQPVDRIRDRIAGIVESLKS